MDGHTNFAAVWKRLEAMNAMDADEPMWVPQMNENGTAGNSSSKTYLRKPLDIEEFKKHAHEMVDFIADYYKKVESLPVLSKEKPGYLRSLLPDSAPEQPESLEELFADVEEKIIPGLTHWQSPNFYGYFPAGLSTASFLGEMLSSGFGILNLRWMTSPVATELEALVCDWLAKMLKLPQCFLSSSGKGGGVVQVSASEGVLVSLLAARNEALKSGAKADKLVVYISDQTNSCVEKACTVVGICPENVRKFQTSSLKDYALKAKTVRKRIDEDKSMGWYPTYICGTIGTTSSTAIDPLRKLAKIAEDYKIWFHVDGAYGGCACICEEYRKYLDGVEGADSFGMNPHKCLLTNFDCSVLWIKNSNSLTKVLSATPEYLKGTESDQIPEYKDWQIHLGSRFRSLKLWMVLRLYGVSKLKAHIRNHVELAKEFVKLVKEDNRFEIMAPRTFALVCFRISPPSNDLNCHDVDLLNKSLLDALNENGGLFLSHTELSGKYTLRFCVGGVFTKKEHVDAAWKLIKNQATIILKEKNLD